MNLTAKIMADIVKEQIVLTYRHIQNIDNDDIVVFNEPEELAFVLSAISCLKSVMPYYEREYTISNNSDSIMRPIYLYIKSILHAAIFKVDPEKIKTVFHQQGTIPDILLYPNEALCWNIILAIHHHTTEYSNDKLTPFFQIEHCSEHRDYVMEILIKAGEGRLYEISDSFIRFVVRSLMPFHRMATATLVTNLLDRNPFTKTLENYCAVNDSVGLIFLDIDFFKQINDDWGHAIGDEYLCKVADVLVSVCKQFTGVAGRCGGEEFRVAFFDIDKSTLIEVAKKINEELHKICRKIKPDNTRINKIKPYISASIGCAVLPSLIALDSLAFDDKLGNFYKAIDTDGVYYVKENGRDNYKYVELS